MNILVVGLGYVGTVSALSYSKLGHNVYGCDSNSEKINDLSKSNPPFFEPGLDQLVNSQASKLRLFHSLKECIFDDLDFIMICVGTPTSKNGKLNLQNVFNVINLLLKSSLKDETVIVLRSTIEIGTIHKIKNLLLKFGKKNEVLFHPEFLREGSAINDFNDPPFTICSDTPDINIKNKFTKIYDSIGKVDYVSIELAEILKIVCNTWHALKIAFANEVGLIARSNGVNPQDLMEVFSKDFYLNISKAYLRPGFAYGGSCLPKDTSYLSLLAENLGLKLIPSINPSNQSLIKMKAEHVFKRLKKLKTNKINIIGLTFKKNTDDLRDSPYVKLAQLISQSKIKIDVYDPNVNFDSLKGANLFELTNIISDPNITLIKNLDELDPNQLTLLSHEYEFDFKFFKNLIKLDV